MKPYELNPRIETPGDLAAYFIGYVQYHGSSTIPQQVIDRFGGHLVTANTQVGSASGFEFKINGSFTNGQQIPPPNCNGTVAVNTFGLRVRDEAGNKLWWVDFSPQGDPGHQDMHYQESGWPRGKKVYSSAEPEQFRACLSKWQSSAFKAFITTNAGNEACLYSFSGGC